ncbi:TIGR00299 family protein [Haloarcula taiwanensis]|uniref:Putative nickel insertion protein n=1 Tax=Haloarcula taiwanensis TaxID=1932004 RepID=A0A2H4ZZM0_9EURY|nr:MULTISPECIES: nickel pincer cofactor biosynthesis protein LarC [Haloarcula]AUG47877.1 TIGR00299 family protein [Haloarcula taiwanensis]RLM39186.1 nickel pincer cofactor biosynthesis protein LarC [Haloarcula sp. Atlit-120R]RLM47131.1 nickel pincer cofactor biosynthesis protein LarC [Haloarcula sp. Atlit-47R]
MRTLAFDGRIGAAGDMLLGALLAAGADREALSPVEDALDVEYAVSAVDRSGIAATRVDVLLTDADDVDDSHDDQSHSHSHDHDEGHGHAGDDDAHPHTHEDHDHTHAEGRGPSRTYAEVVELVGEMDLPATVRTDALAIFEILGEAEASVHGTDLDDTHFHEVGADDAIADIVGVCLLLDDLDIERVVTTPLATGGGTVEMSHGSYPVPTPAVVAIAEQADWSLQGGPIDRELLTPTGAAILAHIADGTDSLPPLDLDASGYGAGGWDLDDRPNVLRAMVGDGAGRLRRDEITVLETNVDDVPPEVLGDLQRSLPEVGARDVSIVPTTMKKSRPGHIVKVICRPEDAERVARRLAEATGTLGVRESGAGHRWVADREYKTVALSVDGEQFEVTVKVASDTDGTVFDVSAEYDDAAAVADATGLPVRAVMQRAERMVRE